MTKKLHQQIRILLGSEVAIGPGKAELLEAIAATASISAAARHMQMSYRRAWLLVDTMNRCFVEPLVVSVAGGKGGGGATLTVFGKQVLQRYRDMEARAASCIAEDVAALERLLVADVALLTPSKAPRS